MVCSCLLYLYCCISVSCKDLALHCISDFLKNPVNSIALLKRAYWPHDLINDVSMQFLSRPTRKGIEIGAKIGETRTETLNGKP